jgi:hypothetical protein
MTVLAWNPHATVFTCGASGLAGALDQPEAPAH